MAKDNLWWTVGLFAVGFIGFHLLFNKKAMPVAVPVPVTNMISDDGKLPNEHDDDDLYNGMYNNYRNVLPSLRVSNRARGCGCNGGH